MLFWGVGSAVTQPWLWGGTSLMQCEKPQDPGSSLREWSHIFPVWIADMHKWLIIHAQSTFSPKYIFWMHNKLSLFYMKYDQCSLQEFIWICWLPSWTSCERGYAKFSIFKCQFLSSTWTVNWEILKACCLNIPYPCKGE